MEFNLPNIYEEILEKSFEEEALVLKNDELMSILLKIQESDKIQLRQFEGNENNINTLFDNGYIREKGDSYFLTQKGVSFLNLLGITSKYFDTQFDKDNEPKVKILYNYNEILNLSKIQILKYLSIKNQKSNEFFRFDINKSTIECTLFLNCFSNINDFLINLRSIIDDNTKITLYYQFSQDRRRYLSKSYGSVFWIFFPLVDLIKSKLKNRYVNKRKLKYLLFYNTRYTGAEVRGRINYCGYKIIEERCLSDYVEIKIKLNNKTKIIPSLKVNYSTLMKSPRIGKNEKTIYIYKFRTMYPFAEFTYDYNYHQLLLSAGFEDLRFTKIGKLLRKLGLDELPMLINLFKGDLKLFGIRPLSRQFFELYPSDFRPIRNQYKPGLISPFFVDIPEDLEGIVASERRYLESYDKNPWITDIKYLFKAYKNILFNKKLRPIKD